MSYPGYWNSICSNAGIPIVATVTVYLAGTATKATIYSTPSGTLKDNPFQSDVLGRFQFFAASDQYDVEISGAGITTYKIEYIDLIWTEGIWIAPTLLNSWVNFGSGYNPAGYYKDALGVVHLRGMLKNGTFAVPMFVLPAGYKPAYTETFVAISGGAVGFVNVGADGQIVPVAGINTFFSLDGMTFHAA